MLSFKNIRRAAALCCICFVLASCGKPSQKIIYNSDCVRVVREGNKTTVYDLIADKEYNYTTKLVKRSKAVTEPYTTVDTDTIKIEIIPSGLSVYDKAKNIVFTVTKKITHRKGWVK